MDREVIKANKPAFEAWLKDLPVELRLAGDTDDEWEYISNVRFMEGYDYRPQRPKDSEGNLIEVGKDYISVGVFHYKLKTINYEISEIIFTKGACYSFDFLRENPLIPKKKEVKPIKWQDQKPWCNFEFCEIKPNKLQDNKLCFYYKDEHWFLNSACNFEEFEGYAMNDKPQHIFSSTVQDHHISKNTPKAKYVVFKKELS
jgi:hypothetical protein